MFYIMSQVTYDAHSLGIPVLAEVLPADPDLSFDSEWIAVCARVGYEAGPIWSRPTSARTGSTPLCRHAQFR